MVSVERIQEYQDDLDREAPYLIPEQDPPQEWPQYGQVKNYFNFVYLINKSYKNNQIIIQ